MKKITQVLGEIRGGMFVNEATEALRQAVERCQESGKKATLTISITLEPHGRDGREMHVKPKLAVKLPARPDTEDAGIFYVERGNLVREDPRQAGMFGPRAVDLEGEADGRSPAESAAG